VTTVKLIKKMSYGTDSKFQIQIPNHIFTLSVGHNMKVYQSGSRWEDNIKMYLWEIGWMVWTGCIWLRIRSSYRLL